MKLRTALLGILLGSLAACTSVEYRHHRFEELSVDLGPPGSAVLNVFPTWRTLPADSGRAQVSGPPYVVDFRVSGPVRPSSVRLVLTRAETGHTVSVDGWDEPIEARNRVIFVDRGGVDLEPGDYQVDGAIELADNEGPIRFSGIITYQFVVERRNRLMEAVRGI